MSLFNVYILTEFSLSVRVRHKLLCLIVFLVLMSLSLGITFASDNIVHVNIKNDTVAADNRSYHLKLATLCFTISGTIAFMIVQVSWYK